MSTTGEKPRAVTCPSCEAPLTFLEDTFDVITCKHCLSSINVEEEFPELVEELKEFRTEPYSFIELGNEANFGGKRYQVIGRISYISYIKEWDPKDSQYYSESWDYDEWTLVGEDKQYIYIYEDKEGYAVSYPVTPDAPKIPGKDEAFLSLFKDHSPQRIKEFCSSRIEYYEGEFTWMPKRQTMSLSEEYDYGVESYSVSRRLDFNKEVKEVEFFKSIPATRFEMAQAFERQDIVNQIRKEQELKAQYKSWSWGFFIAAFVCMFMAISSCSTNPKVIGQYSFDFKQLGDSGVVQGPVYLRNKGVIHKIEISASINDNSDAWGAVELLDSNQVPINAVDEEFWRESGYDSDGHWSEGNVVKHVLFYLEKPGAYFIRLIGTPGHSNTRSRLNVKIYENVSISRYYFIAMFLSFGFGIALRKYRTLNPWYAVLGIFVLGLFIIELLGSSEDD